MMILIYYVLWWGVCLCVCLLQKIITCSSCVKARFEMCSEIFQKLFWQVNNDNDDDDDSKDINHGDDVVKSSDW